MRYRFPLISKLETEKVTGSGSLILVTPNGLGASKQITSDKV